MSRDHTERDIHMVLDGELPPDEAAGFDAWLSANPEMKARSARFEQDRERLRNVLAPLLDEPVPARLAGIVSGEPLALRRMTWWRTAAAAALIFALGGLGGYLAGVGQLRMTAEADDRLAEDAMAAHVIYSAENRHAVEVGADEKDHLLSWLSKRVGLTLVAPDLTEEGFHLVGGRLLPAGRKTAALFLYEDKDKNRISVYVTSEGSEKSRGTYNEAADGPSAVYWLDKGYGCAIVGSLPPEQLSDVARNAYRQLLQGAKI